MKNKTYTAVALIVLSLVVSNTPAGAINYPGPPKVVVLDCGTHATKPTTLTIYCADFGVNVNHIKWTKWSQSGAIGTGQYSANDCTPNCASGKVFSSKVKLSLAASKLVKSEYVMNALTIITTSGRALPLLKTSEANWSLE